MQIHFAALWAGFLIGWSVIQKAFWADLLTFVAAFWFGSAVIGSILFAVWRRIRIPRLGPYCPGCRYNLKGLAERRCPECGRRFTLDELHISENDLRV